MLVSQLSDAVAKTTTHFQLVQTNAERWQAAEIEVAARIAEYTSGQSTVNMVLQSQQRKAEAQITYYRALGEYNKSINYVDYLQGTLLANNNITLAEGPWNQKAYWDALERARERSAGREQKWGVTRPSVVRQGPVRDADSAAGIIGSGALTHGEIMPPSDPFIDDDLGIRTEPYRQPVEINEQPLTELGTPTEMMSPNPSLRELEQLAPTNAIPEVVPAPNPTPSQLKMDGPSVLVPTEQAASAPRSKVTPAAYQVGDVNVSVGPEPVRRKPLPAGS